MKARALLFLAIPATIPMAVGCATATAQSRVPDKEAKTSLVIYKDDFAMIRDLRDVTLTAGDSTMQIGDLSRELDPNSVQIDFPGSKVTIASTTFDLGSNDRASLIDKLAGQTVQVMLPTNNGETGDLLEGILEPSPEGFLLRTKDKTYINPPGTLIAPKDAAFSSMPSLHARIQSNDSGGRDMQVSYLTRGLSWSADYVAKLMGEDSMKLELWATVQNATGSTFRDATITFMAGSPNRAALQSQLRMRHKAVDEDFAAAKMPANEYEMPSRVMPQASGELYAYHAPANASLGNDQMNRVPMMASVIVPITKDYSVQLPEASPWSDSADQRTAATLAIRFKNNAVSNLGLPLPAGAVRFYSPESEAGAYIGASSLGDTPKDGSIYMTLSDVFDIYTESKALASTRVDKRTIRKSFEVVTHNEKATPVKVRLVQSWSMSPLAITESARGVKLNSRQRQWTVDVPAGGEAKLVYSIDLRG